MVASDRCFHCDERVGASPVRAAIEGKPQVFCCNGCATAAQWIRDAHLDAYYQLRTAPAPRIDETPADLGVWDREEVQREHARDVSEGREMTVLTDGMHCAACAWLIDRALMQEPGVQSVSANAVTGRVRIVWDTQKTQLSRLLARLNALGYRPYLAAGVEREEARRKQRNLWLIRIGIAGLASMQAMMFAEALYLDVNNEMPVPTRDFFRWITFLVSTPVVFWAGWPFLSGASRELRSHRPGMDTLVSLSTVLAWGASAWETVRGGPHVWYDAAVMFVFLLLVARMLEQSVRNVASAQVDALARARPRFATLETEDDEGRVHRAQVPVSQLNTDDIVAVSTGEVVPADGVLLDESAAFSESLLTGESAPVRKAAGDAVLAGSMCADAPARLRVTHTGTATRISQLTALVERAQAHRPKLAEFADKIAAWFVVALVIAACAVYVLWRIHAPERAFEVMLAVLVVSCPCALSLAIPAALAAANGRLSKLGVLPLSADALTRLSRVTDVIFDKTGTLTTGVPTLTKVEIASGFDRSEVLAWVAALEQGSGHPIALAFRPFDQGLFARNVKVVPGAGVMGSVGAHALSIGHSNFVTRGRQADDGKLWLSLDGEVIASFELGETARNDARETLSQLHAQGIKLHLASGDAEAKVAEISKALGIDAWASRQTPEDKLMRARNLQALGHVVGMVGDGINDAPVLAGADVSVAMGEGAAIAQRAADLVLSGTQLEKLPRAIELARATRKIIAQNLFWALAYNVVALPIAAMGWVTPWMAAVGMAVSSLIVTLNALRLSRSRLTRKVS
ncbi:cadmium-translocating P-type ATPase [Lysobacter sp. HDW10]|uniref:heavy metal translocating P-type ATPase n=1 Tax=Lysobacter sp. HDW10 TaxID=2714936 RepID=UPI00140AE9E4|nr:heavy metal translocating P-type ATPase [Lysobacter sp. HDW10]QIK80204.1 cadmium-translocating P-type ATPase [Lysobacter sp. HDW10]